MRQHCTSCWQSPLILSIAAASSSTIATRLQAARVPESLSTTPESFLQEETKQSSICSRAIDRRRTYACCATTTDHSEIQSNSPYPSVRVRSGGRRQTSHQTVQVVSTRQQHQNSKAQSGTAKHEMRAQNQTPRWLAGSLCLVSAMRARERALLGGARWRFFCFCCFAPIHSGY